MKHLGFVLLVLSGCVMAEEVYYCSDDDSNGFVEKNGVYKSTLMSLRKFKMKLGDDGHLAIDNGGTTSFYYCLALGGKYKNSKSCTGIVGKYPSGTYFNFNPDNGRYIRFSGFGYVYANEDTVGTEIGTCTKF